MKKKLLLALVVLFTSVTMLMAQGGRQMDPEARAKATVERLKPELSLTEQQEKDITPVYTDFYSSMKKLMENGRPSPEDRKKLTADRDEKLKAILSEEQMTKLAEAEEKMRQQRRQGGGNQ